MDKADFLFRQFDKGTKIRDARDDTFYDAAYFNGLLPP